MMVFHRGRCIIIIGIPAAALLSIYSPESFTSDQCPCTSIYLLRLTQHCLDQCELSPIGSSCMQSPISILRACSV